METLEKSTTNRTVDRALEILNLVADNNKDGLIFSDISKHLGIPKSSLHPIMLSLVNARFLSYVAKEKAYYLGEAMFNLGNRFADNSNILASIERIIENAVIASGYTSFFGVLSGNEVRYLLRKVSSSQAAPASPQYALKASCSGVGKALLLDFSEDQVISLFSNGMPQITKNSITDARVLYNQLKEAKEKDIVFEKEESTIGIQCRATPIRYQGKILAAVSISFPIWVKQEEEIDKIEKILREEKAQIERLIAQNPSRWIFSSF